MKYLKTYDKLFEDNTALSIDKEIWEEFKDILQIDILDVFQIPNESMFDHALTHGYDDPVITIIDNKSNFVNMIPNLKDLSERVKTMSGYFLSVFQAGNDIYFTFSECPTNISILNDFNLEPTFLNNSNTLAGYVNIDQAIEIINHLNTFYKFADDDDIELLKNNYEILRNIYNTKIKINVRYFEKVKDKQFVAFEFELVDKLHDKNPVFVIDPKDANNPYILIKNGLNNIKVSKSMQEDFLQKEEF
jgi:hypothetical protein